MGVRAVELAQPVVLMGGTGAQSGQNFQLLKRSQRPVPLYSFPEISKPEVKRTGKDKALSDLGFQSDLLGDDQVPLSLCLEPPCRSSWKEGPRAEGLGQAP